jgi:hypothetical protein
MAGWLAGRDWLAGRGKEPSTKDSSQNGGWSAAIKYKISGIPGKS